MLRPEGEWIVRDPTLVGKGEQVSGGRWAPTMWITTSGEGNECQEDVEPLQCEL